MGPYNRSFLPQVPALAWPLPHIADIKTSYGTKRISVSKHTYLMLLSSADLKLGERSVCLFLFRLFPEAMFWNESIYLHSSFQVFTPGFGCFCYLSELFSALLSFCLLHFGTIICDIFVLSFPSIKTISDVGPSLVFDYLWMCVGVCFCFTGW